jgi:hypothetical protein
LELAFETKDLRTLCEIEAEAKRKLKGPVAEMLKHRVADLKAALSLSDLVAGRPRLGDTPETMLVDLRDGYRLVFAANHQRNPRASSGDIDWPRVSRIRITAIEAQQ